MQNIDDKIDLILEQSLEEIVAQMGSLTTRQALDKPFSRRATRPEETDSDSDTSTVDDDEEEEEEDEGDAGLAEALVKEDKLTKIIINFENLRKQSINESFLAMFGGWVEHILSSMFGGFSLPVEVTGTRSEVESFAKTIGREKRYIESARRYGLDHPTTYKSKSKLDTAVKNFEKDTGLKWPFK